MVKKTFGGRKMVDGLGGKTVRGTIKEGVNNLGLVVNFCPVSTTSKY